MEPSVTQGQPPLVAEKPYISPSQLDMYTRCGVQYYRRYPQKQKIPPGIKLIRGSSVHKGAEVSFVQKKDSRQDLPAAMIKEVVAAEFDMRVGKEGVLLTPDEEAIGSSKVLGAAKDTAVRMGGILAEKVLPKHQPVMIEETQRILMPKESHDLVVKMDVVTDQEEIPDIKTGRRLDADDIKKSVQMILYALAYNIKTGHPAKKVSYENIVENKSGSLSYNPVEAQITRQDYQVVANRMHMMLVGLKAGVFLPAPPGAWWCSTKFCGYATTCPYFLSGQSGVGKQEGSI